MPRLLGMDVLATRLGWFRGDPAGCGPTPRADSRAFRLILLGPPGVGKGTQAELLCQRLRTCHLSTGDLFRAAACGGSPTPAMAAALAAMGRGELVSDKLVIATVAERAGCLQCRGGFLLDGFPRTLAQAEALTAMFQRLGVTLDGVIAYDLPTEEIVGRLGGRRTCVDCKAVYHMTSHPPAKRGACDHCGGQLVERDDDKPEAVRVRMDQYAAETAPLAEYYARRGELISIAATGRPDEIFRRTVDLLEARIAGPTPG